MTKQKSFKGRVRARMEKTSESYTAARRQLLAKAAEPTEAVAPEAAGPAAPVDAPGATRPYSDDVLRANTGRTWDEWFALLDRWGAAERPHPEIARWLNEEHGVDGWWAQGVTVGYEQARGLRAPGQRRGGLFEVNASKTVAVPVDRLYEAFMDPGLRERWLPGAKLEVRAAKPAKSIRANWDDGSTRLVIAFTARGDAKSQVALVHERVPDAEAAAQLKTWWRERVAVLKEVLET
ncbi:MAG TPA: hypothetical protein VHM23_25235 [Actinomycetota bacterium]|jgi:uncharacterized protein YndB with AHSA1/START domain|nr:hypothetical protein [Actinomycetota bacterium]